GVGVHHVLLGGREPALIIVVAVGALFLAVEAGGRRVIGPPAAGEQLALLVLLLVLPDFVRILAVLIRQVKFAIPGVKFTKFTVSRIFLYFGRGRRSGGGRGRSKECEAVLAPVLGEGVEIFVPAPDEREVRRALLLGPVDPCIEAAERGHGQPVVVAVALGDDGAVPVDALEDSVAGTRIDLVGERAPGLDPGRLHPRGEEGIAV